MRSGSGPIAYDLASEIGLERESLMTADDVARRLAVSRRCVYEMRYAGILRGIQIGRSVRFLPTDVLRLLEAGLDHGRAPWE